MTRRVLVAGSRNWTDWRVIVGALREEVVRAYPDSVVVVHGACPTGADRMADFHAHSMGLVVERHPADWKLGKAAGPVRNEAMVQTKPDVVLAFLMPESRGTRDCVRRAERDGIPVRQFHSSGLSNGSGGG